MAFKRRQFRLVVATCFFFSNMLILGPAAKSDASSVDSITSLTAADCSAGDGHYYTCAQSGTGSTTGTLISLNMPADYQCTAGGTSDEASWLIDFNTASDQAVHSAIELGYFQGYWPYPGTGYMQEFSYPQGYDTFQNGLGGHILTTEMPASDNMTFEISSAGGSDPNSTQLAIYDNAVFYADLTSQSNYVDEPRTNYSQAEVTDQASPPTCWMGGNDGTGTKVTDAAYQADGSSNFTGWGGYTDNANSPYEFEVLGNSTSWKSGGPNGI